MEIFISWTVLILELATLKIFLLVLLAERNTLLDW